MKKVFLPMVAIAMLFAACNNEKKSDSTASTDSTGAKPSVTMPFTANYSTSFEMGNPAYTAMIEQGSWKDWQENTMDNMKSWVADTIRAYQSDNAMVKGVDSLTARWKRGRAMYTSVKDTIDAAMAVYSTDKKENWVLVWATEINTDTKGVTDTIPIMETWRINKDGKADLLLQFDRHTRKK